MFDHGFPVDLDVDSFLVVAIWGPAGPPFVDKKALRQGRNRVVADVDCNF